MSQNTHQLLLFFADQARHETAVRAVLELRRGELERSAELQARLGIDLTGPWTDDWFNHAFKASPEFIRLDFDTSAHQDLPLQLLAELFEGGLRAAVLEVFHSQVGETERYHFCGGQNGGQLVNREAFYQAEPDAARLVNAQLCNADDDRCIEVDEPTSLVQLLIEQKEEANQRDEVVQAIRSLTQAARETDDSPGLIAGALVPRVLVKGLSQALLFTVVSVLLFKGTWLWIVLGLVLAVWLPIYHGVPAKEPSNDDAIDPDAEPQEATPC